MKKTKQISLVRTLIAAALLLIGSSGGVAWGQSYIGTPGDNINGAATNPGNIGKVVNNQFGAGESAEISDGNLGNNNQGGEIVWPNGRYVVNSFVYPIFIGGSKAHGGKTNIVINSYNADGDIQGWVRRTWGKLSSTLTGAWHCNSQVDDVSGWNFSYDYTNQDGGSDHNANAGSNYGKEVNTWTAPSPYYTGDVCPVGSAAPYVASGTYKLSRYQTFAPYTVNQNTTDDGTPLVQKTGVPLKDENSWTHAQAHPPLTTGTGLVYYKRPTTVAISGTLNFDAFTFKDLEWWYMTYTANRSDVDKGTVQHQVSCDRYARRGPDCDHDALGHPRHYSYQRQEAWSTVGAHHWVRDVNWIPSATPLQNEDAKLDAAIQIMAGSDLCVRGGVIDSTTTPHSHEGGTAASTALSGGDYKTDALLVWPISGSNFRLKVGGEMDINMIHDNPTAQPRYTSAGFPSSTVQDVNGNMYLYQGTKQFSVIDNANGLTAAYANVPLPYSQTNSGVLGVYGKYNKLNPIVHTAGTNSGSNNNHGVIEVGPAVSGSDASGKGWFRFHIYSGGTIKNFTSPCKTSACANVWFAGANTTTSGSPKFIFDNSESLNILNDGNCCDASILFEDAGAIGEITTNGVNASTGNGDLLIRAHGNVELKADADFQPTASQDNNISILSDLSYISTKAFKHTAGTVGGNKGHLTL